MLLVNANNSIKRPYNKHGSLLVVWSLEAKIWYSKKEKVFLKQQIQVPTGATEEKYTLNINNFKINFYKTLSKFENYDTINENKKLKLLSNFYLPIEIIKKTNYEYKYEEKTYTEEELFIQTKIT